MKRTRYFRLVALLLSDGGIGFSSETRYIHFTNKSEVLLKMFEDEIRKFSDAKIHKQKKERGITLRVFDINLVRQLLQISPNFRTKPFNSFPVYRPKQRKQIKINGLEWPSIEIPEDIFRNKKDKAEFIRIYASCDGYPSIFPRKQTWSAVERIVAIVCHHPMLKQRLSEILFDLEIPHSVKKYSLEMRSKEGIEKFAKQIGFTKGVTMTKNSKHWFGLEKNEVLRKIILSYDTKFHSRNYSNVINKIKKL